jgi:hypothetical protein
MISLCPSCHAKVHRTKVVFTQMPPLLLELWREQHPKGHEQTLAEFLAIAYGSDERATLSALKQETESLSGA